MASPKKIQIKELDVNTIHPVTSGDRKGGSKIVVIGKPGSGKSFLIDDLIYQKRHVFPVAQVISGTEDSNKFFSRRVPETFIYDTLKMDYIQNFIRRQKLAKELQLENPWSLLVCDDCMDNPKLFHQPVFQNLFKNGRHWKMLFILGMQYCMDIPPALRTCIDGVFVFRDPNPRNRKILYENYAGIIPSFKIFCDIMDQITDDHTALYIDNRQTSNDFQDCVFWYKAREVPEDFKVGSEDYWLFHKTRYDPQHALKI
jgi:hypothetical protein